jgi:hypothetical protein
VRARMAALRGDADEALRLARQCQAEQHCTVRLRTFLPALVAHSRAGTLPRWPMRNISAEPHPMRHAGGEHMDVDCFMQNEQHFVSLKRSESACRQPRGRDADVPRHPRPRRRARRHGRDGLCVAAARARRARRLPAALWRAGRHGRGPRGGERRGGRAAAAVLFGAAGRAGAQRGGGRDGGVGRDGSARGQAGTRRPPHLCVVCCVEHGQAFAWMSRCHVCDMLLFFDGKALWSHCKPTR